MLLRASLLGALALLLSACSLKPGLTKHGAVIPVAADSLEEARRLAVRDALDLFLAPGPKNAKAAEGLVARAGEFTRRARVKKGRGAVEVRFGALLIALERDGLLRPAGFSSGPPRVLLLVSEPQSILDLGVGPAADALRRVLAAHGATAIDGRDHLNEFKAKGKEPADLAAGAARLGADWLVVAAASASAELEPVSRAWQGRATLVADQYRVKGAEPAAQVQGEASVLDVSSAAARGKALEQAGENVAARISAEIVRDRRGRAEGAVFVVGAANAPRLKALLADMRGTEGVAGAHLAVWRDKQGDGLIFRVFLDGIKIDDFAARLLMRDRSLTLLSVEPENGRLDLELPGARD